MENIYFGLTEYEYRDLISNSSSLKDLNSKLGKSNYTQLNKKHKGYIKKLSISTEHFNKRSKIYKISDNDFTELIKYSNSYSDVLIALGMTTKGNSRKVLKDRIISINISIEHFYKNNKKVLLNKKSEDIFIKGKKQNNHNIKKYLFDNGYKKHCCENCGFNGNLNKGIYYTGEVSLDLHHINGDNLDNTLSNLQILCPNCHRLTKNFGSKNKKNFDAIDNLNIDKIKTEYINNLERIENEIIIKKEPKELHIKKINNSCIECKKKVSRLSKYCLNCYQKKRINNSSILPKNQLIDMLNRFSFVQVGKYCGVSDTTIRKWCKNYEISHYSKDYDTLIKRQVHKKISNYKN